MKTIHKYIFGISDYVTLVLPVGAVVLHVGSQPGLHEGDAAAWALVDTDVTAWEEHRFRVYGTGHPLPDDIDPADHAASWCAGPFVWHLFREATP